jgi:hypothetical protein
VYDNHLPDCEANIARLALFAQQTRPPARYAHAHTRLEGIQFDMCRGVYISALRLIVYIIRLEVSVVSSL